jgi:hypothetical protein
MYEKMTNIVFGIFAKWSNKKSIAAVLFTFICIAIFALMSGGGSSFFQMKIGRRVSRNENQNTTQSAEPRSKFRDEQHKIKDPRLRKCFLTTSTSEDQISSDQLNRYFAAVGRTDRSLSVAYWLTEDSNYINELRNFPDSGAALSMLAQFGEDPKLAEQDAARLMELEPNNPLGHYLTAYWQAISGNTTVAMAKLDKVSELPGSFMNDTPERTEDVLGALKLMGMDSVESHAYLWSHFNLNTSSWNILGSLVSHVLETKEVSDEKRADYASQLLKLYGNNFGVTSSFPEALMKQCQSEAMVLSRLPEDFEYGENKTVGSRRAEIKSVYANEIRLQLETINALKTAEPKTADDYVERIDRDGFLSAREWLLREPK